MTFRPMMSEKEVEAFLDREFPQIHMNGRVYSVAEIRPGEAVMRLDAAEAHLRPGGTVSGPTLFALSDLAAYVAILAHIGPVALAVTTNLSINFLRKPPPGPLLGTCRILKLGKRLAVTEIAIAPPGSEDLVAHATATYSIPPHRDQSKVS
ncbi:PaaI family thioesterase [Afifella pfennigii]|uniref:PaaI family thioesterase n=1 Tax=Afifella pfennigii TaxID=209897 RepID=UPI00047A2C07|nr:PaaI family thioesterase [Afifella pfennigii]